MAEAAQPILASALWTAHQSKAQPVLDGLETGVTGIDRAMEKCIRYGKIACISAQPGDGQEDLCLAYLTSHLLGSESASATIIDASTSFDVRKIYQHLVSRLTAKDDPKASALKTLDRVKIMKVFDFEGLVDAVSEVRQSLQNPTAGPPQPSKAVCGEDDEILDMPKPPHHASTANQPPNHPPTNLLLIDRLDHLIHPQIKANHTAGQSLLAAFMRSLSHLTKTHSLCTILTTSTMTYANAKEEPPSAFASCKQRPTLGKSFARLVDTQLMLHQAYLTAEPGKPPEGEVMVVEVLQDRGGSSYGRWAPFTVDGDGRLSDAV